LVKIEIFKTVVLFLDEGKYIDSLKKQVASMVGRAFVNFERLLAIPEMRLVYLD
jgi:hypothetical protein